jgi:hypothetical protein
LHFKNELKSSNSAYSDIEISAENLQLLPEDGQLQNLTDIVMEETDTECEPQQQNKMSAPLVPNQSGASGDCDPIETRGFISSEIAQELARE